MFDDLTRKAAGASDECGEDDFAEEMDAEAAAICLGCRRKRCALDDHLPCRLYLRKMRALTARRKADAASRA